MYLLSGKKDFRPRDFGEAVSIDVDVISCESFQVISIGWMESIMKSLRCGFWIETKAKHNCILSI
jgi:hypothetical protein